jgi:hypothetical protein
MPHVAVYLTASEYLGPFFAAAGEEYRADPLWLDLVSQHPRDDLLAALAVINHATGDPDLADHLREHFSRAAPGLAPHLQRALAGADGQSRVFLARGLVLRTIRAVLTSASSDPAQLVEKRAALGLSPPGAMELLVVAILLTHQVADSMGRRASAGEPMLGGMPQSLAMELVQNTLFHQADDVGDLLARTRLLWCEMDVAALRPAPRAVPMAMLEEVTGAPYDVLIATAFALWAKAQSYTPNEGAVLAAESLPADLQPHLERTLAVLARTPDELAGSLRGQTADWQMLPLQEHPVADTDRGLLVLDETYLLGRVTSGLFWLVHDHEKAFGDDAANRWRSNHAGLFEQLAERRLQVLAPPLLGGASTYFTEEDLERVFPGQGIKRCDVGIHFGVTVVLAEIVSGQVSVPTRTRGDVTAFRSDLDRLVFSKARQLNGTAERLLADLPGTRDLLGAPAGRIHPVIVHAGQFPHSRVTGQLIEERLASEHLLRDARIAPLALVGLDDLELAELVRGREGRSLPDLLDGWRASEYAETSLRNYLIHRFQLQSGVRRPAALQAELEPQLREITRLLDTSMPGDEGGVAP